MTTASEFREQLGMHYDKESGDIYRFHQNENKIFSDGITIYNQMPSSPMSDIYISKSILSNSRKLYTVLGHEFIHASHYKMGLFEAMMKKYGNETGAKLFNTFTEASAYSYSLVSAKSMREFKYAQFFRDYPSATNNFRTPQAFGWRKFGVPTTLK